MRPRLRLIEFFGGPLDGKAPALPEGEESVLYADGAKVYQYVRDEIAEGRFVREVMRLVTRDTAKHERSGEG